MTFKIANVVGARPNFMKIAPIMREMSARPGFEPLLIHTGQHYDQNMSDLFFRDLGLPVPDAYLGVGSAPHGQQTAKILMAFEALLLRERPDLVLVVGDVNSTIACALAAAKLHIPVAHVEAGLRSFDRRMPEEINRVLTDAISDYLFVTEQSGIDNLRNEGVADEKIYLVGNVMIDTLLEHIQAAEASTVLEDLSLSPGTFSLLTLHRPENVDVRERMKGILDAMAELSRDHRVVFPVHPRTKKQIASFGLSLEPFQVIDPIGYLDFLKLTKEARLVLTDSGGIQEETTILGVPCLTLRDNTERPVTVTHGTNRLVGADRERILLEANKMLQRGLTRDSVPQLWDGKAAPRIVDILQTELSSPRSSPRTTWR